MKKSLLVIALLISFSAQAKCYKSYKKSHSDFRLTDKMVRIENDDMKRVGHSLVSRKTGDQLFLAEVKSEGSLDAVSAACNSEGLTPVFQETSCSGETRTYIVRSGLCVASYAVHNDKHLVRSEDESLGFYPGKMLAWALDNDPERLILLPWIAVAEVVVFPFSTLWAVASISENIERRTGQRRLKKLSRRDVKITDYNMHNALRTLIDN